MTTVLPVIVCDSWPIYLHFNVNKLKVWYTVCININQFNYL